jgi:hypothetical protein
MSKYKTLFIIVFIFLLTRVAVLLFFIDKFFMHEELHHGMIAKEIMEGRGLSIFEYPLTNYGHGGVWSGILTIPFFALFGQNRFALQLTPVAFAAAILIILFLFAYKFFNRRVAVITGVLYIFSSRMWFEFNLHNGGLHFENIIFTVGAMYIFYEIMFNNKNRLAYYFFLGLISGFGTYWIYTFLITLSAIFLLWFLRDKKLFLKKGFYVFCLGFFIGMLPWVYYNLGIHFKNIGDIFLAGFFMERNNCLTINTWIGIMRNILRIICFDRMLSFGMQDMIFGKLCLIIYWLSFLYILRRYKFSFVKIIASKESFLLIFPLVLFVAVSFYGDSVKEAVGSLYYVDWRYVVSFFPFIFLTVAIALDKLFLKFRFLKVASIGVLFVPIFGGVIMCLANVNFKDFGSGFNQPGYSYIFLFDSFCNKYGNNLYKILDNTTKLSAPAKYEVISQVFAINPLKKVPSVDFKEYLKLSLRLDEKYKPFFYRILIKGLFYNSDMPLEDIVSQVDILSRQVDERYKPYFYEGVGALAVTRGLCCDITKYKYGVSLINKKYIAYYYRGLSEPSYWEFSKYLNGLKNCMTWIDKQYQPIYLEGIGEILAKMGVGYVIMKAYPEDPDAVEFYDFLKSLEPANKIYVLQGIGKGLSYFYTVNTKKAVDEFINNFQEEDKKIIARAMADSLK